MGKNKVSFFNSIKTQITLLVIITVLITTVLCMWTVIPLVDESQSEMIKSYMKDVVLVAGESINKGIENVSGTDVLTPESLEDIVGKITVNNMDSSYAYVVSADGTMLYHPKQQTK